MKRIIMARFKCMGCGAQRDVELGYAEQEAKLPEGWCALRGWWHETRYAQATPEEAAPEEKVPLAVECCSYECMEKFFKENILNPELS